jgi:single-strand DNA-binding protein
MKNIVTLVGFVGNNPEVRTAQSGAAITNLSLATTRSFKDGEGNRQTETEWHRITCLLRWCRKTGQDAKLIPT